MEKEMNNNQIYAQNEIPDGVKKWNWGAFMFNIYWGIGNRVYISLLCLIPLVNIVMVFVLGIKGNEWAWKNNQYRDVEEFQKTQATWNRAGLVFFIIAVIVFILYVTVFATMGASLLNDLSSSYSSNGI